MASKTWTLCALERTGDGREVTWTLRFFGLHVSATFERVA